MNYYNEPYWIEEPTIDGTGIVTGTINTNRIYLTSELSPNDLRIRIEALQVENNVLKTRVDELEATVQAIGKAILNID